jgi:hypothetical protein
VSFVEWVRVLPRSVGSGSKVVETMLSDSQGIGSFNQLMHRTIEVRAGNTLSWADPAKEITLRAAFSCNMIAISYK